MSLLSLLLGELDAHKGLFEHRRTVGLEPPDEPDLVGLGVELVQPLDLHGEKGCHGFLTAIAVTCAMLAVVFFALKTERRASPSARRASPKATPWFWAMEFHQLEGRIPPHQGVAADRESAMAAFKRCWESADIPIRRPPRKQWWPH